MNLLYFNTNTEGFATTANSTTKIKIKEITLRQGRSETLGTNNQADAKPPVETAKKQNN